MAPPLISVILPVKDGARYLPEALSGIAVQDYRPLEVIVVDGHSRDGSPQIARDFPFPDDVSVHVLTQPGRGIGEAWNVGLDVAQGALLTFMCSDDRWLPGKLSAQAAALAAAPDQVIVVGQMRIFANEGYIASGGMQTRILGQVLPALLLEGLMTRRTVFERVGRFDESYALSGDADWLTRAVESGVQVITLPDVYVEKRLHDDNLSNQVPLIQRELLRLLRASVNRRRADPA